MLHFTKRECLCHRRQKPFLIDASSHFYIIFNSLLKHFPITSLFRSNSFYISILFQECKIIFHCVFTNCQYLMQFACGNIRIISHFCYDSFHLRMLMLGTSSTFWMPDRFFFAARVCVFIDMDR